MENKHKYSQLSNVLQSSEVRGNALALNRVQHNRVGRVVYHLHLLGDSLRPPGLLVQLRTVGRHGVLPVSLEV